MLNATGSGLIEAAILAVAALGFDLMLAVSDVLNLGFVLLLTVGQFATWLLITYAGLGFVSAAVVGCLVSGLANVATLRWLIQPFRRKGRPPHVILLVTFALYTIGVAVLSMIFGPLTFSFGLAPFYIRPEHIGSFYFTNGQGLVIVIGAVLVVLTDLVLRYTSLGRVIRAIADDNDLARSSGLRVGRTTALVWLAAGFLAGAAGVGLVIIDVNFTTTSVEPFFVLVVAAAFCGGAGKPFGAALGALVVGLITQWAALVVSPAVTPLLAFAILVVIITIRPGGILGFIRRDLRA